jgi:hypothetical protein
LRESEPNDRVLRRLSTHAPGRARRRWLVSIATLVLVFSAAAFGSPDPGKQTASKPLLRDFRPPTYAGIDYAPSTNGMRGQCANHWTYLKPVCWSNGMRARVRRDIRFIGDHRLGRFHRIWLSLDQLFGCWNATTGYCGYDRAKLANLDEMLRAFARARIRLDVVLLQQEQTNSFHFEALDGTHPRMRANYIKAVAEFVRHIAADPVAARAVAVVDLQNEAYFQIESHLEGRVSWDGGPCDATCLDTNVILPWIRDLYRAAKRAAPRFLYTVSDTHRLMEDPNLWIPRYPVDVYDIHFYADDPGNRAAEYAASARSLAKPWFSGEVGCATGNVACTYNGNNPTTLKVDAWWLGNLRKYGAKAVLVENVDTVFTVGKRYELTAVGRSIARQNGAPTQGRP